MDAIPPIFFFTSSSCNSTLFLYESSNHFFSPYSPYFTSLPNNNKNFIFFLVTSFVLFTFLTYTNPSFFPTTHTRAVVQKNTTHTIIAQQQTIFTPAYSTLIFSSSRCRFILNFTSPNDCLQFSLPLSYYFTRAKQIYIHKSRINRICHPQLMIVCFNTLHSIPLHSLR